MPRASGAVAGSTTSTSWSSWSAPTDMTTCTRGSASGSPASRSPTEASPPVSTTYGVASCSRSSADDPVGGEAERQDQRAGDRGDGHDRRGERDRGADRRADVVAGQPGRHVATGERSRHQPGQGREDPAAEAVEPDDHDLRHQDRHHQREDRVEAVGEDQRGRGTAQAERADQQLPHARPAPLQPGLLERRDRRHPGGPLRRAPGAEQRDHDPRGPGDRPGEPGRRQVEVDARAAPSTASARGRPGSPRCRAGSRPPRRPPRPRADSPSTIRRTCRGVAPTRRSRPSWRRRVATTKPKVLPTTKIAMNSATPDMIPNSAARSDSCSRSSVVTARRGGR